MIHRGGGSNSPGIVVAGRKRVGSVVAGTFPIAHRANVVVFVVLEKERICGAAYGIGARRRHSGSLLLGVIWEGKGRSAPAHNFPSPIGPKKRHKKLRDRYRTNAPGDTGTSDTMRWMQLARLRPTMSPQGHSSGADIPDSGLRVTSFRDRLRRVLTG